MEFSKFLIDKNGKPIERFAPSFQPERIDLILEKLLK